MGVRQWAPRLTSLAPGGALLFGSGRQRASDVFAGGGQLFIDDSTDHFNNVLPVGEVELGLKFNRSIGSARAFGQVAVVGQEWFGTGNASRSVNVNSFGVPAGGGGAVVDTDLGILGVAFRLGLNY